jgi:hypothetical protein
VHGRGTQQRRSRATQSPSAPIQVVHPVRGQYFFTQKYPQRRISFEIFGSTLRLAHGKNKADWIEIALPNLDYASCTIKTVTIAYDKVSKAWNGSFTHEVSCVDAVTISKEMDGQTSAQSPEFFCPLPIAYNPFTRQPVQLLYFDPGCKTALTGIKTDGTICEYDINPLRQLNLNHYILIDQLKSRRDKKNQGSKQWRRLNAKYGTFTRGLTGKPSNISIGWRTKFSPIIRM